MKEFSIDLSAEQIADQRTREYFQEVLGSFINGNYRSAVVMLWSVVVADFVYKLQALRDLYQDPTATSILDSIEAKQKANPTNAEWESFLLDEINSRTHLLETADYQHLINLQKLRHLSAHPVLSGSHLLFAPNKETTRSLIRNALEAVLLKPPIFSKKIVGEFVSDIAAKKEFLPDKMALKQYLNAKYFCNLHLSVEHELFKALWKFCFRVSNEDTDANRGINARALHLLYERHPTELRQFIVQNAAHFSEVAPAGPPLTALIELLSEFPALFGALTDAARVPLTTFANTHINLLSPSSFLSQSFVEHVAKVSALTYEQLRDLSDENWKALTEKGAETGQVQLVYGLGVKIYCGSRAFGTADSHFARFIEPHIAEFDDTRLNDILVGIEGNNQTYWRGRAAIDHLKIADRVAIVGNVDLAQFPNFTGSLPKAETDV